MLQKFNITTYAVALCLFGFMLFTAAPVFADPQDEFEACKAMKWSEGKKDKKNCFQNLAEMLLVEYKYASQDKSSCAQYCKLIVK